MDLPPLPHDIPLGQPATPSPGSQQGQTGTQLQDFPIIWPPPPLNIKVLRAGCWLVNYRPVMAFNVGLQYDGTLRLQVTSNNITLTASGDLYNRPPFIIAPGPNGLNTVLPGPAPKPGRGIPILPIKDYRYYLRVTKMPPVLVFASSFTMEFERYAFDPTTNGFKTTTEGGTTKVAVEGTYTASMKWVAAPAGYPDSASYLEGDVSNVKTPGTVAGRLKMGWIAQDLRKMTIEVDTCDGCKPPMANDSGLGWRDVFSQVGFDVTAIQSETTIPSPPGSGGIWSLAEIHQAMLDHREEIDADGSRRVNLDNEWRYHVLAVPTVEFTGHPRGVRGIMYDVAATDSNKVPREGVAVSAKWIHPAKGTIINPSEPATDPLNREPDWGLDTGKAFDQAGNGYFRATVHEIGHCMGLLHNDEYPAPHGEPIDNTFMCPSDSIAAAATPALKYPQNIQWRFSDFNLRRLRHYPDIHVRPGGLDILTKHPQITPFLDSHTVIPGLKLELVPILKELPLGAPVRLDVKLINTGSMAIEVPIDISLKSSSISGSVETPHGNLKDFRPLIHCADESDNQTTLLQPDDSIQSSITLLRGPQGALFPTTGISTITVRAIWKIDDFPITVTGSTTVYIHGAHSESHAAAAHRILTTPDTHLVLVLGAADHLTEGVEAIQQAVQDETLGPHFAGIEAKRLVRKFGSRDVDFERVSKLIKNGAVLSEMEKRGLEGLFRKKGRGLSFGG